MFAGNPQHDLLQMSHRFGASPASKSVVEVVHAGARSPLHFHPVASPRCQYPESSTTPRGQGHGNDEGFTPGASVPVIPPDTHHSFPQRPLQKARSPSWYRRISAPPLDGVCLTLLGVSVGLRSPGVDPWAVARALIESSVDLRTRNARGMTPLHMACAAGQVRVQHHHLLLLPRGDTWTVVYSLGIWKMEARRWVEATAEMPNAEYRHARGSTIRGFSSTTP